ncbi:MAG: hypothetical protein K2X43_16890 [Hyphomonadaceae bacterium]|nr:hypothetical protein [Hyphomonadaceae bacterium]
MTDLMPSAADWLNSSCFCITLNRDTLHAALEREAGDPEFSSRYIRPREHLFSNVPVFLAARDLQKMTAIVQMVEAAARLPRYQETVLAWAPAIARFDPGPRGAFMGYDFHLGAAGPKLIEVNTNAGGAFLNALLAKAQRACCPEVERALKLPLVSNFDSELVRMFQAEWATQRGDEKLERIAIVDDEPESQYLYPEFLLARQTFIRHGIDAVVADGSQLRFSQDKLWVGEAPIDLVYNRLVDFSLERPQHSALREAYLAGAVVVTPNPRNHALLADKRNLTLLSDMARLSSFDLPAELARLSAQIPRTVRVSPDNATELWDTRRDLFFKPATGHGAKAVYRGDKLTRGVWQQILAANYVAHSIIS